MIRLFPCLLVAAAIALPAAAQTPLVDAARRAGSVGERFDGYMGYAVAPTPQLRGQVDRINIRRRALYSNLAAARGVSPQEVGITAGCPSCTKPRWHTIASSRIASIDSRSCAPRLGNRLNFVRGDFKGGVTLLL